MFVAPFEVGLGMAIVLAVLFSLVSTIVYFVTTEIEELGREPEKRSPTWKTVLGALAVFGAVVQIYFVRRAAEAAAVQNKTIVNEANSAFQNKSRWDALRLRNEIAASSAATFATRI
jgi:Na+-transporting methylmalonyl-CoA/oxaloacetate decarboxylase gamma subunit